MNRADNIWQLRCPDEGQWMAFFDGEGRSQDREMLGSHLRSCPSCQEVFEEIGQLVAFGDHALDGVAPVRPTTSSRASWWIPAAAAAVVLASAGTVFHTVGQKTVAAIGTFFQVKQVSTVTLTQNQMTSLRRVLTQGGKVTLNHYGTVKVAGPRETMQVSAAKLKAYSMPDLWPKALGPAPQAMVQTGMRVSLTLNVPNINALIAAGGGHDFFPQSLNHVPFTLYVPAAAVMKSGAWTLEEAPRPTVSVPGRLPEKQVVRALEHLPFLPSPLKSAVAKMANWKETLIIPLPGHPANVAVDGTHGIADTNARGTTAGEAWVQPDGMVVAVMEHQSTPINQHAFEVEVSRLFP